MIAGFIGLGTMGAPMARNILAKGHELVVFDVVPQSVASVTRQPARRAASPREVAERADFVITMLPDAPDVERVASGPDGVVAGIRPGSVYIDMSTIDPATTRRVGAQVKAQGAEMIDSPVGKTADAAVAGTLTLMVGGDAAVDRALPAAARLHGHRLLPLRRARRRADDEAAEQPARHRRRRRVDRGARRGHQGRPHARHDAPRSAHDDGVEQPARDLDAEALAGRQLHAGIHDEARAQGLPARAADDRVARRRRAGRARDAREPRRRHSARAAGHGRRCDAQDARGAGVGVARCGCRRRERPALPAARAASIPPPRAACGRAACACRSSAWAARRSAASRATDRTRRRSAFDALYARRTALLRRRAVLRHRARRASAGRVPAQRRPAQRRAVDEGRAAARSGQRRRRPPALQRRRVSVQRALRLQLRRHAALARAQPAAARAPTPSTSC